MKKIKRKIKLSVCGENRFGLPFVRQKVGDMLRFLAGLALCLMCSVLGAQTADTVRVPFVSDTASVYMTGKVIDNAVWLRWAASSEVLWRIAMERGWVLERYDFDTAALANLFPDGSDSVYRPARRVFRMPPFMQVDTAWLAAIADTCPYAAVLGEAVFSPELDLSLGGKPASSPWNRLSDHLQHREIRFVLANLAYDRSFPVACAGGMGYVDTTILPGYFYLYRIFADTMLPGNDTALFFTRLDAGNPIPPLQELQADFGEHTVNLSWDTRLVEAVSTGYFVERETAGHGVAGRDFVRLNRTPLTVLQEHESGRMRYTDSLPGRDRSYGYRIIGIDLFGHEFPVARSRYGKGAEPPVAAAIPDSIVPAAKGKLALHFSYPEETAGEPEYFSLYVTSTPHWNEAGARLLSAEISPRSRVCPIDPSRLSESSYFHIRTVGPDGRTCLSLPYFYWKKDSLPPDPPGGLFYEVDSFGTVRIFWSPSVEKDLAGYRVFRRLEEDSEPVQLTASLLTDTVFIDTISLRTSRYFYYSVVAADRSGNLSEHSLLLPVKNRLPDKPVPALFSRECREREDGVELVWYNSQSANTRGHVLMYRVDSSSWIPLKDFPVHKGRELPEKSSFVFRYPSRTHVTTYRFTVMAYGENRHADTIYSPFSYTGIHIPNRKPPRPYALTDRDNRYIQIQWNRTGGNDCRRLYLYRRSEEEPLRLLASLDSAEAAEAFYTDFSVRMNTEYDYVIQIEYKDGTWSEYSAPCTVEY